MTPSGNINTLKIWWQVRSQEQRILVLLSALALCLLVWYAVWESGYETRHTALTQKILPLQQQLSVMNKQNDQMKKMLADPDLRRKHDQLVAQLKLLNTQIEAISTQLVSAAQMTTAMKSLLSENQGLKLQRLESTQNSLIKSTEKSSRKLYRHDFVIEFEGTYFPTLQYLNRLEKLPWRFYWDSISYDVTTYPEARIKIQLHTVSADQGLINDA